MKTLDLAASRLLKTSYKDALKSIEGELGDYFRKYAKDGALTLSDMAKYNRLDSMLDDIRYEMNELYIDTRTTVRRLSAEQYQQAYFRKAFAIEKGLNANIGYAILNPNTIKAAVMNPISGLTLNETLSKNRQQILFDIRREVTQGLIRGESYDKMANRLSKTLDGDLNKSIRVSRTEGQRCRNIGNYESMQFAEKRGVKFKKQWISTLDAKTREDHGVMDGVTIELNEDFVLPDGARGPGPGMIGEPHHDINCRCTLREIIDGVADDFRYVRGEGKVPYLNYREWEKAKGLDMDLTDSIERLQK